MTGKAAEPRASASSNRRALRVGINDYQFGGSDLDGYVNDHIAVKAIRRLNYQITFAQLPLSIEYPIDSRSPFPHFEKKTNKKRQIFNYELFGKTPGRNLKRFSGNYKG